MDAAAAAGNPGLDADWGESEFLREVQTQLGEHYEAPLIMMLNVDFLAKRVILNGLPALEAVDPSTYEHIRGVLMQKSEGSHLKLLLWSKEDMCDWLGRPDQDRISKTGFVVCVCGVLHSHFGLPDTPPPGPDPEVLENWHRQSLELLVNALHDETGLAKETLLAMHFRDLVIFSGIPCVTPDGEQFGGKGKGKAKQKGRGKAKAKGRG